MSPTQRCASRLYWTVLLAMVGWMLVIIVLPSGIWGALGSCAYAFAVHSASPRLYRWVTEPERASNEDPLV